VLREDLATIGQCGQLRTQPEQYSPHRHVIQGAFFSLIAARTVTKRQFAMPHCLAVRTPIVFQIVAGELQMS